MSVLSEREKDILVLIDRAIKIYESSASTEVKHALIFNLQLGQKISCCNLPFESPYFDGSYEGEVRDFVNALKKLKKSFGNLVQ